MDRRSPVLHGDRCRHWRTARHVLSRHVSARRKIQPLRRISNHQRKTSAGRHVPGDFVEAPSQMLQNWVWNKKVLDTFAADYRDPSRKIPGDIIQKMNAPYDCVAISNPVLEKVFLPIDPSTTSVTYFGHMNGYDAGY